MYTVKLDAPFQSDAQKTISSIEFRTPQIGDIETSQEEKTDLKQTLKMVELTVQDLSPTDIRRIAPKDYDKIQKKLGEYL